jgi:Zn-dependent protease with chaperone function
MSGEFLAHGATLTFAWFVVMNVAVTMLAVAAAAVALREDTKRSAGFWMSLRLAPSLAAVLFTIVLFAPSYWKYEPRENVEGFDITLTLLAGAGLAFLAAAIARGLTAWTTARRRVRNWMAHARPLTIASTTLPAYAIDAAQPLIALVGLRRPRLLVTQGLIDALTPAELDAAVAHELGHQRAFDNLKRLVICSAPDLLTYFRAARVIEQRWAAAAEHLADRIGDSAAARCALASALVKVARLTPTIPRNSEPISTLISGGEIASRVQRLLADDETIPSARTWRLGALGALAGLAVAFAYSPLLQSVHEITEILVHNLP